MQVGVPMITAFNVILSSIDVCPLVTRL